MSVTVTITGDGYGPALLIGADVMSRFQQVRIDYLRQQVSLGPPRIIR